MNLSNNIAIFAGVIGMLLACVAFGLAKIVAAWIKAEPDDDYPYGDGAWPRRD